PRWRPHRHTQRSGRPAAIRRGQSAGRSQSRAFRSLFSRRLQGPFVSGPDRADPGVLSEAASRIGGAQSCRVDSNVETATLRIMKILVLHSDIPPDAPPDDQDTLAQAVEIEATLTGLRHEVSRAPFAPDLAALEALI